VLVKGADYTLEQVVGADLLRGWGGKVVLADLLPGHSTTATLAGIPE
jgi:D-beta-D-heptose 7-phosphate kinase/D-beta-D-heptose 1-phosphate adenosyltransferase